MKIHFVYAGHYYVVHDSLHEDKMRSFIVNGMKKFNIKKVMVTKILLQRRKLITKEKMENYCKGKEDLKESVNDDLELMFEGIQLGKNLDRWANTYFLPKLTKEEHDFVERKDEDFMHSFDFKNADVDKAEMMLSESDSKFVYGYGCRKTFPIKNPLPKKRTKKSMENQPHKNIRTDPILDDM